jgi:hypothetical protein
MPCQGIRPDAGVFEGEMVEGPAFKGAFKGRL